MRQTLLILFASFSGIITCLVSSPAQADPASPGIGPEAAVICDPGSGYYTWYNVKKPWKVTHATRYEHFTNATGTYTRQADFQLQLSAEVTYSVSGSVGAKTPIASLGAETNLTLKASGSATSRSSISVTEAMNNYAAYVFYDGSREASGSFDYTKCSSNGTYQFISASGNATSYNSPAQGALDCTTTPPSGSLGAVVKPLYC